jgi:uncharacterized protein YdhG (YjbR/CyaY superfamily)
MGRMSRRMDVDAYIAAAPKEAQNKLREIRKAIKSVAPKAEEKMSYGMPYYSYKGRLAYFAAFKDHVSLFAMPPIVGADKAELRKYQSGKSTFRFPLDEKLPVPLIRKIVKAGVERNEARKKK